MADAIYHFVWGTFCDWYVELVKGAFDEETKRVAAWAFDQILVMLHPLMPFITEELWHASERPYDLIVAKWPEPEAEVDPQAKAEMEWLIGLVAEVRSARTELEVPPAARTDLWIQADFSVGASQARNLARTDVADYFVRNRSAIARLGRLNRIEFLNSGLAYDLRTGEQLDRTAFQVNAKDAIPIVFNNVSYLLPVADLIDLGAQRTRLSKAAEAAEKERDSLAARLSNPNFVERAKPEAVEKARADHAERAAEAERLRAALERLG
jgi:valyl-tRNA synthetase